MQFGIFSVGDVTADPTTGHDAQRARADPADGRRSPSTAEELGLDVFATGEHHNPPFVPSSPTTILGYIAAKTSGSSCRPPRR